MWALELVPFVDAYPLLSAALAAIKAAGWPSTWPQDDFRPWKLEPSDVRAAVDFTRLHGFRQGLGVSAPAPAPQAAGGPPEARTVYAIVAAATSDVLTFVFLLSPTVDDEIEGETAARHTSTTMAAALGAAGAPAATPGPGNGGVASAPVTVSMAALYGRAVNDTVRQVALGSDYTPWSGSDAKLAAEKVGSVIPSIAGRVAGFVDAFGAPNKMILQELQ